MYFCKCVFSVRFSRVMPTAQGLISSRSDDNFLLFYLAGLGNVGVQISNFLKEKENPPFEKRDWK